MKIETLLRSVGSDFRAEVLDELLLRSRGKLHKALTLMRRPQAAVGVVKSALGDLLVAVTARGIALNHFLDDRSEIAAAMVKLRLELDPVEDSSTVGEIGRDVDRYLAGKVRALHREVDLTLAGHGFQRKVLDKLQAIPRGALISYRALGAAAGSPDSARAVGNALHNNPVPIYVPCHRVIASDGRIGGYGGGPGRKRQLLRSEGFALGDGAVKVPDNVVWGHRTTQIFCRASCRAVARVGRGRMLFFADQKAARQAGLRPCKICRPD